MISWRPTIGSRSPIRRRGTIAATIGLRGGAIGLRGTIGSRRGTIGSRRRRRRRRWWANGLLRTKKRRQETFREGLVTSRNVQWLLAYHYGQPPSTLWVSNIGLGLYLEG